MADPNSDLQSKINRAVRAVLIDQGAATTENCYAAPASDERTLPNTTVGTGDGIPFEGPGNWHFPDVRLNMRDNAIAQPGQDASAPRKAANARWTKIYNALARSDDTHTLYFTATELTRLGRALAVDPSGGTDAAWVKFADDNADMADFTVLWWDVAAQGTASKDVGGVFWERDLQFNCVACNAVI